MLSQLSHFTATLRTAPAARRTAPIAVGAGWILAVASCSGATGYVPSNGQGPQAPADAASALPDANAPESGDESLGSGTLPDAGVLPEDASDDTMTVADFDSGNGNAQEDANPRLTDGGVDATPFPAACLPASNTDTLPFAVDDQYATSGYEGDAVYAGAITLIHDTTCGGNPSSAGAAGACHTVLPTPLPYGQQVGSTGMTTMGWAGVAWQYPANNWGTQPGYAIPPGATSVAFSARGAAGGEVVTFWIGGTGLGAGASPDAPCTDPLSAQVRVSLTTKWAKQSIPLSGPYAPAVLAAFGFSVSASAQPASSQGQAITFYVDDIRWE
jgi:hypothetical protein